MMSRYQIFTDATADPIPELKAGLLPVEIIPMQIEIGGTEYLYGTSDGITARRFYQLQREGNFASTSQITPMAYFQYFEPWLTQGTDILYLCFSSGMSGTFQSAMLAAEELQQKYPERKIICIDTLCASGGEGFLVHETVQMQAKGLDISSLAEWIMKYRLQVCHYFTVDTFTHLKHGGRVSAATAAMGTALHIKPLLHVNNEGKLESIGKSHGRKKAISGLLNRIEQGWMPELGKFVLIAHADAQEDAKILESYIKERFPDTSICIGEVGPIIGAHTGPGMLSLFYWGNNR